MIGPIILANFHSKLAQQIAARPEIPRSSPLPISPWIAMSLLQKAIRRGRTDLALQAAVTLLTHSPERLWRRCGGIVFEDIGVADLEAVGMVTAGLGGKRMRASLGGEWSVASSIVTLMATAKKCRSADDLLMSIELHPSLGQARRMQPSLSNQQLRRIVLSSAPLHERALALWFILGTDRRPSRHLTARRGEPALVFDLLHELGAPMTAVEIAREGFRRTREVLCLFASLLTAHGKPDNVGSQDDQPTPETLIGEVPGWALDTYTREGRAALARFVDMNADTARWVRDRIAQPKRVDFLGNLLFRVEGQVAIQRLRWPLAEELRHLVDLECQGTTAGEAVELLAMMRADIPRLNGVRAEVMGVAHHAR